MDPRPLIEGRWGRDSFRVKVPVITRAQMLRSMGPTVAGLNALAHATGVHVIDPLAYLCTANCVVVTPDGLPVYRDGAHLNPNYVRTRIRFLDSVLSVRTSDDP